MIHMDMVNADIAGANIRPYKSMASFEPNADGKSLAKRKSAL
jgi:hypothetical protein